MVKWWIQRLSIRSWLISVALSSLSASYSSWFPLIILILKQPSHPSLHVLEMWVQDMGCVVQWATSPCSLILVRSYYLLRCWLVVWRFIQLSFSWPQYLEFERFLNHFIRVIKEKYRLCISSCGGEYKENNE